MNLVVPLKKLPARFRYRIYRHVSSLLWQDFKQWGLKLGAVLIEDQERAQRQFDFWRRSAHLTDFSGFSPPHTLVVNWWRAVVMANYLAEAELAARNALEVFMKMPQSRELVAMYNETMRQVKEAQEKLGKVDLIDDIEAEIALQAKKRR